MQFQVLGPLEMRANGKIIQVRAPRQRALLASLLLSANEVVTVDRLIEAVWGPAAPASAVANLRNHVAALRQVMSSVDGKVRIGTRSGGYVLHVGPDELDLAAFERLASAGRQALRHNQNAVAALRFRTALELWHGPVLDNVTLCGPGEAEVVRLEEARLAVVEECLRARIACGEHVEVIGELSALVVQHPLRESLWALLIMANYRAGRQADALAAYTEARSRLADELGLDPGAELQELQERILNGDPTLVPAQPATIVRCDLPADVSDFTGRRQEIDNLLAAVRGNTTAALSYAIDGMCGVGKSTLALHVAHRLAAEHPDAQLFLDLHGHTPGQQPLTPTAALGKLLDAVGVPAAQIPDELEDRASLWRTTMAPRRAVIVLDNASDSSQIKPLLPGAAGCVVLITSRRKMSGLDGADQLFLDVLPHEDAVELMAHVVGHDRLATEPTAVAEVLRLCGYLPLAVRIAAYRLRNRKSWSTTDLADRLRDQRQRLTELADEDRGVAAALAVSYDRLAPELRAVFRRLGSHPGPDFDVAAASVLAGRPAEKPLEDLVDCNLLQQVTTGRYRFHDLVRTYAAQLGGEDPADRQAALTRLFDHYLHTAAAATDIVAPARRYGRPRIPTVGVFTDRLQARSWLDAECANLLASAAHAARHSWPIHARDFSTVLARYLNSHALLDEALALHADALTVGIGTEQGHALHDLGRVLWRMGRYDAAIDHLSRALTIATTSGDQIGQGHALGGLGDTYRRIGRQSAAAEHLTRALTIAVATGDRIGQAHALHGLGYTYCRMGRYAAAAEHHRRALTVARDCGERIIEGHALYGIGLAYWMMERHGAAADHYRQALAMAHAIGDRVLESGSLNGLGETARSTVFPTRALRKHSEALVVAEQIGDPLELPRAHRGLGHAYHDLGHDQQARVHWHKALVAFTTVGAPEADEVRRLLADTGPVRSVGVTD